jgi:hypothetical protein
VGKVEYNELPESEDFMKKNRDERDLIFYDAVRSVFFTQVKLNETLHGNGKEGYCKKVDKICNVIYGTKDENTGKITQGLYDTVTKLADVKWQIWVAIGVAIFAMILK